MGVTRRRHRQDRLRLLMEVDHPPLRQDSTRVILLHQAWRRRGAPEVEVATAEVVVVIKPQHRQVVDMTHTGEVAEGGVRTVDLPEGEEVTAVEGAVAAVDMGPHPVEGEVMAGVGVARMEMGMETVADMGEPVGVADLALRGYGSGGDMIERSDTVFVGGLPPEASEEAIAEYFGSIGLVKIDRRTNKPKIWMYKDKMSGKPKGECTVTYDDPEAAKSAVTWFNDKDFQGYRISVSIATRPNIDNSSGGYGGRGGGGDRGGRGGGFRGGDRGGGGFSRGGGDRGGGRGGGGGGGGGGFGREGDWTCPDSGCGNTNFAWRTACNRCGSSKPDSADGGGGGGGGFGDRGGGGYRGRGGGGDRGGGGGYRGGRDGGDRYGGGDDRGGRGGRGGGGEGGFRGGRGGDRGGGGGFRGGRGGDSWGDRGGRGGGSGGGPMRGGDRVPRDRPRPY
ncbi:RNA-binding protein cabeza isoform X6 [Folsomia candida]|uniref:RNA-binding protein cabeza isoform X6 n=1 Tax=Folsomia candida TaxID=158441 RepID=UPI001604FC29|nr:RNA-binding protein cabeza isoform X6 [Folsomia candida]